MFILNTFERYFIQVECITIGKIGDKPVEKLEVKLDVIIVNNNILIHKLTNQR